MATPLTIQGVTIGRRGALEPRAGPEPAPAQLQLAVSVENPGDQPLHVWASWRAYEYDATTKVLTVYLTEHVPPTPPGIALISDHPRTPVQVVVDARSRATITVALPATIRRRVPGQGLGMHFVEEPIGPIDRVELHVQSATEPISPARSGEPPERHRERLRQTGEVLRTIISPTGQKEQ